MNVVFITHYSKLYGANKSMLNLIDGLKNYNVESFVIVPENGDIVAELNKKHIPFTIIPFQLDVYHSLAGDLDIFHKVYYKLHIFRNRITRAWKNKIAFKQICKVFKEWNINIVHTNSFTTAIGMRAAKAKNMPHVWHIREFGDLDYRLHPYGNKNSYFKLINKSDHIICISECIKRHFFEERDFKNISVIYNGIFFKEQYERLARKFPIYRNADCFTFLIAGVIQPSKGQIIALRAFKEVSTKIPNVQLLLIGEGSNKNLKSITDFIIKNNLKDKVRLTGHLPDILSELGKANATLICSKNEAFGRIAIESMACGCPVIANKRAGLKEVITNETNGLLYCNDYHDLAKQMMKIMQDQELSKRFSESARKLVKERYTIERYSSEIFHIYSSLISLA